MGTRIEDQPPEHWAGPESLDPTPVWKQFALIGVFLFVGLVLVAGIGLFAAAPQLVTPPALVAGDRLVLRASDLPAAGAEPVRVGSPLVPDADGFWLARMTTGEVVAFRARWAETAGDRECRVDWASSLDGRPVRFYVAQCGGASADIFDESGEPLIGPKRGLDRYLVSVSDDRAVVNLSRIIVSAERTSAPPTP
jgi:hypothetical protein